MWKTIGGFLLSLGKVGIIFIMMPLVAIITPGAVPWLGKALLVVLGVWALLGLMVSRLQFPLFRPAGPALFAVLWAAFGFQIEANSGISVAPPPQQQQAGQTAGGTSDPAMVQAQNDAKVRDYLMQRFEQISETEWIKEAARMSPPLLGEFLSQRLREMHAGLGPGAALDHAGFELRSHAGLGVVEQALRSEVLTMMKAELDGALNARTAEAARWAVELNNQAAQLVPGYAQWGAPALEPQLQTLRSLAAS